MASIVHILYISPFLQWSAFLESFCDVFESACTRNHITQYILNIVCFFEIVYSSTPSMMHVSSFVLMFSKLRNGLAANWVIRSYFLFFLFTATHSIITHSHRTKCLTDAVVAVVTFANRHLTAAPFLLSLLFRVFLKQHVSRSLSHHHIVTIKLYASAAHLQIEETLKFL